MGHIILPNGHYVWSEYIFGSINISQLCNDLRCTDYTDSYRVLIIKCLIKLGKHACVHDTLKDLSKDAGVIGVAAHEALIKLNGNEIKAPMM